MTHSPSPTPREARLSVLADAAYAIGALNGALAASPVARFWRERAAVTGLADCLVLAGASLTPAEFFRAAVGLVEPVFFAELDRALVGMIVAEALPSLAPRSLTVRLVVRLQGSRLLPYEEWTASRRPSAATRTAVAENLNVTPTAGAGVGTALSSIAAAVTEALAGLRAGQESEWHGWLIAALLPALLARMRLTATPLPCLTGLTRGMRFSTMGETDVHALLLSRLAEQAREALAMLRRLEACAAAWRGRLSGLTARSRAGAAAGVFLIWPACTRPQLAAALDVTQAGAGTVLAALIDRGIVQRQMHDGTAFFVAAESLGAFKLAARQGRPTAAPTTAAVAEFEAAVAAFDLLGIEFNGRSCSGNDVAYQHQP